MLPICVEDGWASAVIVNGLGSLGKDVFDEKSSIPSALVRNTYRRTRTAVNATILLMSASANASHGTYARRHGLQKMKVEHQFQLQNLDTLRAISCGGPKKCDYKISERFFG